MKRGRGWMAMAPLLAALLLPACREAASAESDGNAPYTVEPIEGTDLSRVRLTPDGAERIGLETGRVEEAGGRLRVRASAVWIDVEGREWVYTSTEPLVFVRAEVEVDRYRGNTALLDEGPRSGTQVVTVGVAELIGSEFGI